MIQEIQNFIWNLGGFVFTITLFAFIIALMLSWIINRLSWWHKKEVRQNLFYWIKHKKRLNEIINKERGNRK